MRTHRLKKILLGFAAVALLGAVILFGINAYMVNYAKAYMKKPEELKDFEADAVIVPGAMVYRDGSLSHILEDRVKRGVELYKNGSAPKLIMSGDHGRRDYDEVAAMKNYAISLGVPSEDIFMDHAGFSTYETLYRARDVFEARRVIIVTQEYHLYRALYVAKSLGLEARGVAASKQVYSGARARELREVLARNKDFVYCLFKPKPTYLGESIPVSGDGNATNDETQK